METLFVAILVILIIGFFYLHHLIGKAAERRGQNYFVWFLLCLFTPFFIGYLVFAAVILPMPRIYTKL
jgi:hypothetical protein